MRPLPARCRRHLEKPVALIQVALGTDKVVGMTEDVRPVHLVIQGMETAGQFLLGLAVELPL